MHIFSNLPLDFGFEGHLHIAEGVHVFDFDFIAQAFFSFSTHGDVGIDRAETLLPYCSRRHRYIAGWL